MDVIYPGNLGEIRAASRDLRSTSYAAGGHALTTAAKNIVIPVGARWMQVLPRNFSTAVVVRYSVNPYLLVLKTTDLLVAAGNATDASENLQDGSASTVLTLNSLDTLANTDALYIGSHIPFRGVSVDVANTNSTASVMAVTYWNGTTFANITPTDGTANAGAALGQDGNVTWAVPSDWVPAALKSIVTGASTAIPYTGDIYYWTRWAFSAALDSTVSVVSMASLNRSTEYAEMTTNDSLTQVIETGPGGLGNIEALTDAGTANLIVNVAALRDGRLPD